MKFEIKSRFTSRVLFTAELEAKFESEPTSIQMGEAVKKAVAGDANLRGANLRGANLSDANLRGANLSDANLSGANLSDANLSGANLSGSNLSGANLSGANLSGSYLRGANLRGANLSGSYLRGSNLSGANLSGANLSGSYLRDANLSGSYLRDANLSGANLSGSYLSGSNLRGANLSGANLRGANLEGVPKIKNIHKEVYKAAAKKDALDMGSWHTCETTHCRAGWVVHLAGEGGKALEFCMGTAAAAALIYLKNDPKLEKMPNFYASNSEALADMKRLAGLK